MQHIVAGRMIRKEASKAFFFEKKKQKTFFLLLLAAGAAGPERDFGYFAGDLITTTTNVTVAAGATLDPASLPPPGPITPTLDLRAIAAEHPNPTTYRITTTYQNFLAPDQVTATEIPAFIINAGGQVRIPAQTITISPFRHDLQPVTDPAALRPDPAPPAPAESHAKLLMQISATTSLLCAALLFASRLPITRQKPFAAARARLHNQPAPEKLLALHRAFNATAGRNILAQDVDDFIAEHPVFAPLHNDVRQFFVDSCTYFFAATPKTEPETEKLARALARAERRA